MAKVAKAHVEGCSQVERKKRRAELGTLHSLTVQPKTRARYEKALEQFWAFLRRENLPFPRGTHDLDRVLCIYVEHLWSEGFGRALAADTVAGIQDAQPNVRKQLPATWRLLKAWNVNEIPSRAPPLPEEALQAMIGHAIFHQEYRFAISLLVGFYGVLRTGELLGLTSSDVSVSSERGPAVVALGYTKGGQRQGAAESVSLTSEQVIRWLHRWTLDVPLKTSLCTKPSQWRKQFNDTLVALGFDTFDFRPYSLRRGGATYWFRKWGSLDRLLLYGRWQNARTARTYVNDGLAVLASMHLPWTPVNRRFRQIFQNSCRSPVPVLEPALKSRPGGRGGKSSKDKKKARKKCVGCIKPEKSLR